MSDNEKTWRDILPTTYLSQDHFNPDEDRDLTIKSAGEETIEDPVRKTKKQGIVVHFAETGILPMVFNKTNSKMVSKISGSKRPSEWAGTRINVYVDPKVRFGREEVGGLRVRPAKAQAKPTQKYTCSDCGGEIQAVGTMAAETIAKGTEKTYKVPLCWSCASKRKEAKQ